VAKVDRTVGVGQGAGDEDLACFGHRNELLDETETGHYKAQPPFFHQNLYEL
jgi:hypothetical protein